MIRAVALALAGLTLAGCSLLFDPDDLMGGERDAGATDGGGTDAPPADATRTDAPRIDGGGGERCAETCSLGATSPPTWAMCPVDVGAPIGLGGPATAEFVGAREASIAMTADATLPIASVGFVNGNVDATPYIYEFDLTSGVRATTDLSLVSWTGGDRSPTGIHSIAVSYITPSRLAFLLAGASAAEDSGIWVGTVSEMMMDNLSGMGSQAGPLAISRSPARYYWNELAPVRFIGRLPVDAISPDNFRQMGVDLPAAGSGFAVATDGMVVADSATQTELLLWNGDGASNMESGVPDVLCVAARDAIDPAIASLGASEHVVAWAEGSNVHVQRIACSLTGTVTDCCAGAASVVAVPDVVTRVVLREMPERGFVLAAGTAAVVHLAFLDGNLSEVLGPYALDPPEALDGFDVDVTEVGASIVVGIVQVASSPAAMEVTALTICL